MDIQSMDSGFDKERFSSIVEDGPSKDGQVIEIQPPSRKTYKYLQHATKKDNVEVQIAINKSNSP